MNTDNVNTASDYLSLLKMTEHQLALILLKYPDFDEVTKCFMDNLPKTDAETMTDAEATLAIALRQCNAALTILATRSETLNKQKQCHDKLGEMLSEMQVAFMPDESIHIIQRFHDTLSDEIDYARKKLDVEFKAHRSTLLTNFEHELQTEFGELVEQENVQQLVASARTQLDMLLQTEIRTLKNDLTRHVADAQRGGDHFFNAVKEQLNQDSPYYNFIATTQAYIESVGTPDAQIQRLNEFSEALNTWKDEVEEAVSLLTADRTYQELLEDVWLADGIDAADHQRLASLFGKNGTSFKARLGLVTGVNDNEYQQQWKEVYHRWQAEIHFITHAPTRQLLEHACSRLEKLWEGQQS